MSKPNPNSRSLDIVLALIRGEDPKDNSPLPADSVLNRSEVLRALLEASSALVSVADREARRAQLPNNVGRAWTEEEEADLVKAFEKNMTVEEIAKAHQRTIRAIETRAVAIGLMKESDRKTDNKYNRATTGRKSP